MNTLDIKAFFFHIFLIFSTTGCWYKILYISFNTLVISLYAWITCTYPKQNLSAAIAQITRHTAANNLKNGFREHKSSNTPIIPKIANGMTHLACIVKLLASYNSFIYSSLPSILFPLHVKVLLNSDLLSLHRNILRLSKIPYLHQISLRHFRSSHQSYHFHSFSAIPDRQNS